MEQINNRIPESKRTPVFFTDQGPQIHAEEFITAEESPVKDKSFTYGDAFPDQWFKDNKIGPKAGKPSDAAYWLTVYRSSNGELPHSIQGENIEQDLALT